MEKTRKRFVRQSSNKSQSTAGPWQLWQDLLKFLVVYTTLLTPDLSFLWNGKRRFCSGTRAPMIQLNGKRICMLKRFSEEHLATFTKWWRDATPFSCLLLLRRLWNTNWSSLSLWPGSDTILSWSTCLKMSSWERKRWKITRIRNFFL